MPQYNNIAAALGWTEEHGTEEGLFLQPEEAATIDQRIADAAGAEQAATDLTAANDRITELTGELSTANTSLQTANNRIAELEAENTLLGAESSGKGSNLHTPEDEQGQNGTPSYLRDDNPANVFADRRVKRKQAQ